MSHERHGHIAWHLTDARELAWGGPLGNVGIFTGVGAAVGVAKLSACELGFILEQRNLGYACNCGNLEDCTFPQSVSPRV